MTTIPFMTAQTPRATAPDVSGALHTVAPGAAVRLTAARPMALRIGEGQAWVTLGNGEITHGDLVLCAGQTLQLAAGQQAVIEPLHQRRLQYRLTRAQAGARAAAASWWRRAALGNAQPTLGGLDDTCCA